MKKIIALCFFTCAFVAVSVFAQAAEQKVVVIPLNSSKKVIENGYDGTALLTDYYTYIMSGTDVSLPVNGTCVVTATAYVYSLDGGDSVQGPYFRTARYTEGGSPVYDSASGAYALYVGASSSTPVSATYAWDMTGNTNYRFGCVFINPPPNWADDRAYCRVTWVCSED